MYSPFALLFAVALLFSLVLTPLVRSFARLVGVMDKPDGRRKLHAAPVPKLGGIAVFVAFYASLGVVSAQTDWRGVHAAAEVAVAMLIPSLLILGLGIADDRKPLGPWVKIAVQLVAGLLVYFYLDIRIDVVANSQVLELLSLPATLFWIVLITNAFNVVDGMDGLATGVAFIALSCMFVASLLMNQLHIAMVAATLAGAVLGFLRYNVNPASIFLGDSGSLLLGFQLAVLSIVGSQKSSTAVAVSAPLFILALPLIEAATSTVRRLATGRSIMRPDSGHIHHQLQRLGFTPRRAAGLLYVGSGAFGLISLFVIQGGGAATVGLIAVVVVLVTYLAIVRLGYTEFAEINSAMRRFTHQRRIIRNGIVVRRLANELAEAPSLRDAWHSLTSAARQLEFSYVELRLSAMLHHDGTRYAQRLSSSAHHGSETETSFAVSLTSNGLALGDVLFTRSSKAEPLHSELPLLISAVAHGFPPVLDRKPVAAPVPSLRIVPPPAVAVGAPRTSNAEAQRPVCGSCGSPDIHRSRSRSIFEQARKRLDSRRIHECVACGWRGWTLPKPHVHEAEPEMGYGTPDLEAIDLAIASSAGRRPPH